MITAGYNKHIGLFLIIQSLSPFLLLCPGSCHSFFTCHPLMKFAGFLAAFASNVKQSSGLCVPFFLQWGHSLSSPLILLLPLELFLLPLVFLLVKSAVVASASVGGTGDTLPVTALCRFETHQSLPSGSPAILVATKIRQTKFEDSSINW